MHGNSQRLARPSPPAPLPKGEGRFSKHVLTPSLEHALEALRVLYLDGGGLALLLDYDGTLTPIVARPELATLAPDTRRLLGRLAVLPRVRVGVISGRKLDELQALVNLPGIYYAGAAGMELDLRGNRVVHPLAEKAEARTAGLISRLQEATAEFPGAGSRTNALPAPFTTATWRPSRSSDCGAASRKSPCLRKADCGSLPVRWPGKSRPSWDGTRGRPCG